MHPFARPRAEARQQLVARLRAAVQAGQYQVDPASLAEAMLRRDRPGKGSAR